MSICPVFRVVRCFVNWFETWVDIASGGFMSLFKSMSFGHCMSEWFLMVLNITPVLCN